MNGMPLKRDLETRLGVQLKMENDANCFALAEARLGAAQSKRVVFGVILGTGVGGGVVVDGQTLDGLQSIAGEWGHNVLDREGYDCYCGKRGCVETVISGYWLEHEFKERTGRVMRLPEIVSSASTDSDAARTIERLVASFAEAISVVINIMDPDCIVIGGGVGNIDALYTDETRAKVAHWVFNDYFDTPIVKPLLGDSAGALGAALLVS
jgi:predicted NBD/HSP70 family sugar kinase